MSDSGSYSLRPYQQDAVDAIMRDFEEFDRTLLVLPTGTGKTRVFTEVLHKRRHEGRSLVLAHREELRPSMQGHPTGQRTVG
jgi:superfamily II DNA or RNA helicase